MTLELDHQLFDVAVAEVRTGADTFHDARQRISLEVESLLDGDWTGVAADAFADGWADWRAAADDVLDGLVAIGQLLDATHHDLTGRDTDSQTALTRVTQQISGRLG